MLLLLFACTFPEDAPSCLLDELHGCGVEIMHVCNQMLAYDGLTVTFSGGAPTTYDARVTMDGTETVFACGENGVSAAVGTVWWCDETGFMVSGHGDHVEVEVTVDGVSSTVSDDPCWTADEPNGRCCGWNYQAEVGLSLE